MKKTIRKTKLAYDKQIRSRRETTASPPSTSKHPKTESKRQSVGINVGLTPAGLDLDRARAEPSLVNSELRYRRLFETAQDGILILDAKTGAITDVNPYLINKLGYSREEFIEKKLWEVGAFRDIEASKDAFEALQKNAYIRYKDLPLKAKDGRLIPVEFVSNVYPENHHNVIQCNIRDITERKQAELTLRESDQRFQSLIENASDLVLILNADYTVAYVSPSVERILGHTVAAVTGAKITDFVEPQDLPNFIAATEHRVRTPGHSPFSMQVRVRHADGSWRTLEGMGSNLLNQPGVSGLVINARDITESKRAEDALEKERDLLRTLMDNVPDTVYFKDTASRFTRINHAHARLFGLSDPAEAVGKTDFDFFTEEHARPAYEDEQAIMRSGQPLVGKEEKETLPNGRVGWVSTTKMPLRDQSGRIVGTFGISREITERKRAEEEREITLQQLGERVKELSALHRAAQIFQDPQKTTSEVLQGIVSILPAAWQYPDISAARVTYGDAEFATPSYSDTLWKQRAAFATQDGKQGAIEVVYSEGRPNEVEGPFLAEERNLINTVAYDLTVFLERRRVEKALRESEERYHRLVELLPDGVVVHSEGRVVFANPATARIIGAASSAEMTGKPVMEFVHPEHRELALQRIKQSLGEARPAPLAEEKFIRLDGTPIDVEVAAIPFSYAGKPAMLTVFNDITARKRAEQALRQRLTELEAVHTVSTALRAVQTRDEALPILLDETLAVLETDAGAIWMYHADSGELRFAVDRGWFGQLDKTPLKPGEGIAGTVFTSGQAHRSTEFARDPLAHPMQTGEIPAGWGGICLPIHTGAITVGVLFVAVPLPRQITTEQVKLLESLTEMAGTTLHRMSLHEETVRQLDRLEALHSIDLAINASMDLQVTLNVLLEHVKTQLNADATCVLLLDPHSQTLEYAAGRGFRTRSAQTAHIRLGENFAGRAALERRAVQSDDPAQVQKSPHFSALWAGEGFAAYYGIPLVAKGQVKGVLEVYHRASFYPESDWISFLETLAGQAAIAIENAQLFENLEGSNTELILAYDTTIEGWSHALDLRDRETEGHTQRVTEITTRLAKAMGIGDAELVHVRRGALLHDIGKMGVPDEVLLKPGKLTDEEWVLMRKHPQLAHDLISPINYLRPALDIPYCHHEKWDGTGYPRGLKGEQIPLVARIFAVVDVWDALRSDRPYRLAWTAEQARENIVENIDKHFDPEVVKAFLMLVDSGELGAKSP